MIVYKKVSYGRYNQDRLYSAFINGKYQLEYKPGEWTTPTVGKIFAFDNLNHANLFRLGNETWTAEAEDVEEFHPPVFSGHIPTIEKYIKSYWKKKFHILLRHGAGFLTVEPVGSVVCSRIKLLEKVC